MSAHENAEAAFIAKATANTTHEIRNVLAIVKESAGLIDDMVRLFADRGSLDQEKFANAVRRIDAQVSRGADIVTKLNRFAHSIDHHRAEVDLQQEVHQVVFLCQRYLRQKRHEVHVQPCNELVSLVTNSLWLQMALCSGVECCLEQLPERSALSVSIEREAGGAAIRFMCYGAGQTGLPDPTQASGWSRLCELVDSIGAVADTQDPDCRLKISLPAAAPP
jgi:C4-dicarboxylate-specific signal transduction histidine kinase